MAEENENIIEEVSSDTTEQVEQQETKVDRHRDEQGRFKSKFESAGDDNVFKVDLNKTLSNQESEQIEQQSTKEEEVDIVE